ncbi:putative ABC transporter, permease protein [Desulfonema limicola]|uniref:ABC transporter, permease protein n=1 Tax=Desulfonema limicola TaxID=45656 RepID=A0A975GIJ3_9BACT|nr:iron ABC transporter permease [Desulfonema limicola]QTA82617.1 putative ABC transporter, permease protein [Desulfonema limicola]
MSKILKNIYLVSGFLLFILIFAVILGLSLGSSQNNMKDILYFLMGDHEKNPMLTSIIWQIRFPRVILAAVVGASLSLGGLVFQALLRNPLAEPYILGISGGSAIGAIIGILAGLARFPGVCIFAFTGSMATLGLVLIMGSGESSLKKDSLLLSGVMINAFCSSVITFLISLSQDSRIHNILFWLMGDMSLPDLKQAGLLTLIVFPCFILIFRLSHVMNLMLMGQEMAQTMGVNIKVITLTLLAATSLMISATVSYCGLLGFVGLVIPHLLRLIFGPDHRVLVPACILGGGAYMIFCDILARILPQQGEMPTGVITAMIGAPLFIYLLKRSKT